MPPVRVAHAVLVNYVDQDWAVFERVELEDPSKLQHGEDDQEGDGQIDG